MPRPTPTGSHSPTPTATPGAIVEARVIARIEIPDPWSQTAFEEEVAQLPGSIWLAIDGRTSHLVGIDVGSDEVAVDIKIDPSTIFADDGSLWTISPVGMAPGPDRLTVSRVDLGTNEVIATDFPEVYAAGAGYLWGIDRVDGLIAVDPATGAIATNWPEVGLVDYESQDMEFACDRLWIRGYNGDNYIIIAFDPATGTVGTPIDITELGMGRIHETADGCWAVRGSPGEFPDYSPGYLAKVDSTGLIEESKALFDRIHVAGETFWASRANGVVWRIDPLTGRQIGQRWQMPSAELPTNPKFIDWRLMSADGDLYLLTAASVYHLDIPTAEP